MLSNRQKRPKEEPRLKDCFKTPRLFYLGLTARLCQDFVRISRTLGNKVKRLVCSGTVPVEIKVKRLVCSGFVPVENKVRCLISPAARTVSWTSGTRGPCSWRLENKLQPSLDKNLLKNYHPISNLPFMSKILEKVGLHKLLSRLQEKNLSNPFQSAYRAGYSTETVLLRIVNDILSALDNDNISVLRLLDLSAAFDTTDHQILLSRLNSVFWHSVYCTPMVSLIPLRQISVHFNQ